MNWWRLQPTDGSEPTGAAVAPSMLAADYSKLSGEIQNVEQGGADLLHLDVMDGHFVPVFTYGPIIVRAIRQLSRLKLLAHLMIDNPERYLNDFVENGADLVTIHAEASTDIGRDLALIESLGARKGIALNPDTALGQIDRHLDQIDLLLVMSVYPGRGGQKFLDSVLPKVSEAREVRSRKGLNFAIEIDGGINPENAGLAREAGADILVAGTAVFKGPDYAKAIREIRG